MFSLQQITFTMAAHLLRNEDVFHELRLAGVNHEQWPGDTEAKKIFSDYVKTLEEKSYPAARLKIRFAIEKGFGQHGIGEETLPMSLKDLIALYPDAFKTENVRTLAHSLLNAPVDHAEELISRFQTQMINGVELTEVSTLVEEVFNEIDRRRAAGSLRRVFFDFKALSNAIDGFNPGRFTILYADTGFGKTNIAVHLALSCAKDWPAVYLNQEMTPFDMGVRLLVAAGETTYKEFFQSGDRTRAHLVLQGRKLKLSRGDDLNVDQIAAIVMRERREFGAEFFIIDYDQKIILKDSREDEWKQMQRMAVTLERVAIQENVHILLLCQSNGKGEISGSARMKFGAYTVMRFYKDPDTGLDLVSCEKNRGGVQGATIKMYYDRERALVREEGLIDLSKLRAEMGNVARKEIESRKSR